MAYWACVSTLAGSPISTFVRPYGPCTQVDIGLPARVDTRPCTPSLVGFVYVPASTVSLLSTVGSSYTVPWASGVLFSSRRSDCSMHVSKLPLARLQSPLQQLHAVVVPLFQSPLAGLVFRQPVQPGVDNHPLQEANPRNFY